MSAGGLALDDAAWDSPWRARCVRDKALLSLGLLVLALVLPTWPGTPLVAVAALGVLLGPARVPARLLARCVAAPAAFLLAGALPVLVTVGWVGGPSVRLAPGGAAAALGFVGHGVAGLLAALVLAATTPLVDLVAAGRRARVPDACLDVASLTYRFVFLLLASARTIREAQRARLGYVDRRRALRSSGALAAGVLVRSWERARRLEDGLAGRGYEESLRTLDAEARASSAFVVATVVLLVALAGTALAVVGWRA